MLSNFRLSHHGTQSLLYFLYNLHLYPVLFNAFDNDVTKERELVHFREFAVDIKGGYTANTLEGSIRI